MRPRISTLLIAAALYGIGAAPARAQNATIDSRWIAYLGCWESVAVKQPIVCFVPAADPAAIDLVTVENGEVVTAEQIIATAARFETAHGECSGWHSAQWSAVSDRLYLHSEESCPGWGTRTGSGVIAINRASQLTYIQGSTVGTKTGVRVQRYHEARADLVLPSEVKDALDALHVDLTAAAQARATATAPLAVEDIAEASQTVDADVVEAWLVERGGSVAVDAKRLVTLANAGVPSRITDLLIALSYPGVFAIDASGHRGERRVDTTEVSGPFYSSAPIYGVCDMDYLPFPYASYYCDGFGSVYQYGYAYYPYTYPVTVIYLGSIGGSGPANGSGSHGRVLNGHGYQEGPGSSPEVVSRWGEPRSGASGSSSGPAANPSSSTSASSGEQRTAKPRP